jgi:hypothetical protein
MLKQKAFDFKGPNNIIHSQTDLLHGRTNIVVLQNLELRT